MNEWFDERKEANIIASKSTYDEIYDAAVSAFKRLRVQPRDCGEDTKRLDWLCQNVHAFRLLGDSGIIDADRESIDAAMKEQG